VCPGLSRPPALEGWTLSILGARCQNSAGAVTRTNFDYNQPQLITSIRPRRVAAHRSPGRLSLTRQPRAQRWASRRMLASPPRLALHRGLALHRRRASPRRGMPRWWPDDYRKEPYGTGAVTALLGSMVRTHRISDIGIFSYPRCVIPDTQATAAHPLRTVDPCPSCSACAPTTPRCSWPSNWRTAPILLPLSPAARYGLRMLRAAATHDNVASQKALAKAGFVPAGPAAGQAPGISVTWPPTDRRSVADDARQRVDPGLGWRMSQRRGEKARRSQSSLVGADGFLRALGQARCVGKLGVEVGFAILGVQGLLAWASLSGLY
jgi:hypothetical protein